ncbi:MFS transporter [Saccharopolyspora sp. HNM0986]|uniref:MFS transporter n=1 Tax=Saccharopolyspora galaxeae TaxID=2781241 RepID=UPI00190CA8BC|nr:MFS transporter [Saccharopolyspora sp. HNM0986]MBK0870241.1 MFS transporter [Saccharopolyspora sp. HNM0986]
MKSSPARASSTRDWIGVGVALLAIFMGQIDMFIVNVASPPIQKSLGASFGQMQFIIDGYVILYAAGMVTCGKLGDRLGRKRVFQYGVAAFTLTSLLCALAPTASLLIAARALQGAAAAVLMPQVLSLIYGTFGDSRDQQRAVGLYGAVIGLGVVAGLIGGGLLLHWNILGLEWRTIFLINVPVGLVMLAVAPATIRESRSPTTAPLDTVGTVLTATVLPALLVPLFLGAEHGWPLWVWVFFATAAVLTALLFRHQRWLAARGGDPLLPPKLLGRPGFPTSMAAITVFFCGNSGCFLVLTYHLQSGLGLGPLGTGLVFVPMGLGFAMASVFGRGLAERYGSRVLVTGALLMAASYAPVPFIVQAGSGTQAVLLAAAIGVSGIGQGLVVSPLINLTMAQVPDSLAGAASGVINTMTQAAMALGIAAVGTLYRGVLGANPQQAAGAIPNSAYANSFAITCVLLGLLALATAVLSRVLGRRLNTPEAGTNERVLEMR